MPVTVKNYAKYLAGEHRWALGRFIVPVGRLEELSTELKVVSFREPWKLSAILSEAVASQSDAIARFNEEHSSRAEIDVVELKAEGDLSVARAMLPGSATVYFEVPADAPVSTLEQIAATGSRAKIRTGGLVDTAFPAAEKVAQFIVRCSEAKVAFKATAGLHHPLRCVRPLTYAADAPRGMMHGFLNVFLAACLYGGLGEQVDSDYREQVKSAMLAILLNETPANFVFEDDKATLRGMQTETSHGMVRNSNYELTVSTEVIRHARQNFAIAFGSCSFEEPIEDLRGFHLL